MKLQPIDYTTTFYKSWETITGKTRFEILMDQITNYISNYGEDSYTTFPETGEDSYTTLSEDDGEIDIKWEDLKVIETIELEECIERCIDMLQTNIAMNQETLKMVLNVIGSENISGLDMNLIQNKEVKMFIHYHLETIPEDSVEFVRYLVYLASGSTLLIKNKRTINALKNCENIDFAYLINEFGIEKLSEVFYRFKPLFLAMKDDVNKRYINKLSKLAKKITSQWKRDIFKNC